MTSSSTLGRGFLENKHSTDAEESTNLVGVCTSIHPTGKS